MTRERAEGRGGAWTEERGACDERRRKALPPSAPGASEPASRDPLSRDPLALFRLAGQSIIVTGASGALGRVVAEALGALGARLTLASGSYGSTFYTLIGLHAVHVVGAVVWLLGVLATAQRQAFTAKRHVGVTLCGMYWYFVCALWALLFVVVYLI